MSDTSSWQATFNSEFRYLNWTSTGGNSSLVPGIGTNGGSGSQIYLPFGLQVVGRPSNDVKLEFLLRSGEIWTRQNTAGGGTVSFSSPTDTTVGMTTTYYGWAGVQPFASFNVNIPTGRTIINGVSSNTRMDADMVPTPVFGEGWNTGPTIGALMPINESLIVSLAAGYTNRGPYDRVGAFDPITSVQGTVRYDPGDVYTINSSIGYRGERGSIQFSASNAIETASRVNGDQWYRPGDRIVLTGKAGYSWTDTWASRLSVSYAHTDRDWIAGAAKPGLVREAANSNGDVYRIAVDTTFNKENISIGPTASVLYRAVNGYASTAPEFVPDRTGWSLGVIASYQATQRISFNARMERMWVRQGDDPANVNPFNHQVIPGTAIPMIITNGWLGSLAAIVHF